MIVLREDLIVFHSIKKKAAKDMKAASSDQSIGLAAIYAACIEGVIILSLRKIIVKMTP